MYYFKNTLSNNIYSLIKENQKNSLNIDQISEINNNKIKKNLSSENYTKTIIKNLKNGKSRNNNNQNFTYTTIINTTTNTNTNNTILTQNINKTINNEKKNELFTLNLNFERSIINKEKNKSRNSFLKKNKAKNSSYFNEKEKNKIYKTYFSVENIRKKTKKVIKTNGQNNFASLKNGFHQKKRNSSMTNYKVNNIQKIENFYIPSKKDLIKELNKFKKEVYKLKSSMIEMEKKLKGVKEENKKIKLYILNTNVKNNSNGNRKSTIYKKSRLIDLIYSCAIKTPNSGNMNAICPSEKNQLLLYDSIDKIKELKKQYEEKKVINDIINLMKNFYLEYNYSFSSNEAKKIINSKDISTKLLWNWFKNVPKLLFYENIKNNLDENQKTNKNYKEFVDNLYQILEVNSFQDLKDKINKFISYNYK